ncbi:MAG: DsbC family protein [Pseudomonadota bacterium]|nr:DsbC family protein [Pseudomonadota bacterium]
MKIRMITAVFIALALVQPVAASGGAKDLEVLRSKLQALIPGAAPDSMRETPVPGIWEVVYGTQVMYFSADGKYAFSGSLFDLEAGENLTSVTMSRTRMEEMSRVNDEDMIIYEPSGKAKHTITVFTDVDCVYCRKLHSEMSEYSDLGIKVRYVMFPRSKKGSPGFQKAVSVWCADDRNAAMDLAKAGKKIPEKTCKNPVTEQHDLGLAMGVNGTPAILLESGELLPGYKPADKLSKYLDETAAQKVSDEDGLKNGKTVSAR